MLKEIKNVISNSLFKEPPPSVRKTKGESTPLKSDTVSISPEAKRILQEGGVLAQNVSLLKDINREPLVREDKITLVKKRLESSFYQNKTDDLTDLIFVDLFT